MHGCSSSRRHAAALMRHAGYLRVPCTACWARARCTKPPPCVVRAPMCATPPPCMLQVPMHMRKLTTSLLGDAHLRTRCHHASGGSAGAPVSRLTSMSSAAQWCVMKHAHRRVPMVRSICTTGSSSQSVCRCAALHPRRGRRWMRAAGTLLPGMHGVNRMLQIKPSQSHAIGTGAAHLLDLRAADCAVAVLVCQHGKPQNAVVPP